MGWPDWFCDFLELSTHRGGRAGTPAHLLQGRFAPPEFNSTHTHPPGASQDPETRREAAPCLSLGTWAPQEARAAPTTGRTIQRRAGAGKSLEGSGRILPSPGPLRPQKARPPRLSHSVPSPRGRAPNAAFPGRFKGTTCRRPEIPQLHAAVLRLIGTPEKRGETPSQQPLPPLTYEGPSCPLRAGEGRCAPVTGPPPNAKQRGGRFV